MVLNYNPEINIFNHDNIDCCCHIDKPAKYWQPGPGFVDTKPITDMYKKVTATSFNCAQHCARRSLRAELEIHKDPHEMAETNIYAVIRVCESDTVFNIQQV